MLIETVVLALVITLVQGGQINNLKNLAFRWVGLALFAFVLQFIVNWHMDTLFAPYLTKAMLHDLSYLCLIIFLLRNHSIPGAKTIAAGILLNFLVIGLNGGTMPVDPTMLPEQNRQLLALGQGGTHGLLTASTHLKFLADRIYIYLPLLGAQLFSIGDIFIDIGSFYLIYATMKHPRVYRVKTVYLR